MPVKPITTALGHSLPPEGPHTITMQLPGWESAMKIRSGDQDLLNALVSIYPRFCPFNEAKDLCTAIHAALSLPPTHGLLPFTAPDSFAMARAWATSPLRVPAEVKLAPGELVFYVVDIGSVRLYVVAHPLAKTKGIIGLWKNAGTGVSTRLAAELLKVGVAETLTVVPFETSAGGAGGGEGEATAAAATGDVGEDSLELEVERVPVSTYLPEGEAHQLLRERIASLLRRAPAVLGRSGEVKAVEATTDKEVVADDVYLYPTGMAAIYRLHQAISSVREGAVVALGSLFQSTWYLFVEEGEKGFKHFGECDEGSGVMDALERYLMDEVKEGRRISYVFVEFPSNPILVSVNLKRLRELADRYEFPIVVDDTVGSFCNIDVLPVADIIMTSVTKSFSGYANVMGGTLALNPNLPHYATLKATLTSLFHNEYFLGDAEQLLVNSNDYLARSAILNRNALALANFLHNFYVNTSSPVTKVLYPTLSASHDNYRAFMRPPTAEFPHPGYGCLLSIEFETKAYARAFYDNLQLIWGGDPSDAAYHAAYGVRGEQIRVSVGLEDEQDLIDTFREAMGFAEEEKRRATTGAIME
ncbi:pyridoxal phosphate-dependent transferase [Bombardia bombarda]|uniref:Pyridoxal phosphate-dependent transferase n=1 Tax=Bombardia bombarda TaxID=252184 RepID=A0AA39WME0_9PEZI|nr:pyridoxal phosphate-dependent transferase [Bombardia bombarda]